MPADTQQLTASEPDPWEVTRSGRLARPLPVSALPDSGPDVFLGPCVIDGVRYANKAMIRVANVTVDGTTCTVPLSQLIDTIDSGGKYEVEVTSMRLAEFNQLEEFMGW